MAIEKLTKKQITTAWLVRIVFLVVAVALVDLTPLGGNIRYYNKWASCGSQPVQVQSWGGTAWYEVTDPYPTILRNLALYCSPIDAERAGYSASRDEYSFPNLEKAGEPIPMPNGGAQYPDGTIVWPDGTTSRD